LLNKYRQIEMTDAYAQPIDFIRSSEKRGPKGFAAPAQGGYLAWQWSVIDGSLV